MYINAKNVKEKTYSSSKTFEAVHIWWNCLAKMKFFAYVEETPILMNTI